MLFNKILQRQSTPWQSDGSTIMVELNLRQIEIFQ